MDTSGSGLRDRLSLVCQAYRHTPSWCRAATSELSQANATSTMDEGVSKSKRDMGGGTLAVLKGVMASFVASTIYSDFTISHEFDRTLMPVNGCGDPIHMHSSAAAI